MRVVARPRIHIGLADTGGVTARAGGGVGFALDGPVTIVEVTRHTRETRIEGVDLLDTAAHSDLDALCRRLIEMGAGCFAVNIVKSPRQHIGLGSKTSLALAIVAGVDSLFGMNLATEQLQLISARGGLSGIGIHTFFAGGVVQDGGHPQVERLAPSSRTWPRTPPPLLARFDFPHCWRVALLLDLQDRGLSGEEEARFFADNLPTEPGETHAGIALLNHGVLPALRTAHLAELRLALQQFHSLGFKARELAARSERTNNVLRYLQNELNNAAAGMSSTGPLIYVVLNEEDHEAHNDVAKAASHYGLDFLGLYRGWNRGFEVDPRSFLMESEK